MDVSHCRYFKDLMIIGSLHAVRFGNKLGRGGKLTEKGRRAGLAVSGQTLSGLTEELKAIEKQACGVLCFIGANDVKSLAADVLDGSVTMRSAQDRLRADMSNLVRVLCKTFSGKIVVCETISCRWKRLDKDWGVVASTLEYHVCRIPKKHKKVSFVPVNHLLTTNHYERFIGPYRKRDYVHLNKAGYSIVAKEVSAHLNGSFENYPITAS